MKLPRVLLLAALVAVALLAGCKRGDLTAPDLYARHCARCHGDRGEGDQRALRLYPGLDLIASPMGRLADRVAIRQRIAEGEGPMPAFKRRLDPGEIEKLVEYTIQLSTPEEDP